MLNNADATQEFLLHLKKQKNKNKYLMFNLRMCICELE